MVSIRKCKFAKLNDRCYNFSSRIISFPFGHPYLSAMKDCKTKAKEKLKKQTKTNYRKKTKILKS